jgi:hypothetical protein
MSWIKLALCNPTLFPSYEPPSTILKRRPSRVTPAKAPSEAGVPARPSGFSALCMDDDVITTL